MNTIYNSILQKKLVAIKRNINKNVITIFLVGLLLGYGTSLILPLNSKQLDKHSVKGAITENLAINIFDFIKLGFENDKAGIKWTVLAEDRSSAVELVSIKDRMPTHIHKGEDHYTYVISGNGEYIQSGKSISLEPGRFILTPMNTPHEVISKGQEPLLLLVFSSPKPFNENDIEWMKNH